MDDISTGEIIFAFICATISGLGVPIALYVMPGFAGLILALIGAVIYAASLRVLFAGFVE